MPSFKTLLVLTLAGLSGPFGCIAIALRFRAACLHRRTNTGRASQSLADEMTVKPGCSLFGRGSECATSRSRRAHSNARAFRPRPQALPVTVHTCALVGRTGPHFRALASTGNPVEDADTAANPHLHGTHRGRFRGDGHEHNLLAGQLLTEDHEPLCLGDIARCVTSPARAAVLPANAAKQRAV